MILTYISNHNEIESDSVQNFKSTAILLAS